MGMGGMDPRLSMMGMPMMSPGMGMTPGMGMNPAMHGGLSPMNTGMGGMNPGMGMGMNPMGMGMGMNSMGMGAGAGGGVGMQMTGNTFDPRISSGVEGSSQGLGDPASQRPSGQNSPMPSQQRSLDPREETSHS